MFQLPAMAIRITFIVLNPTGWFTIFGYAAMWAVLFAISFANYKLLDLTARNIGKFALMVVYLLITPVTAAAAILIYSFLFVVLPAELIVSNPSNDSGFVALWVGVAAYTFSLVLVPVFYLLHSTKASKNSSDAIEIDT